MRKKNLHRKNILSGEYVLPFLPLPVLGTANFVTVGSSAISNLLVVGSIMMRHMKLLLGFILSLRAYCPMRSTHNIHQGVIMTSLVHDHTFGCVSCVFWQDMHELMYDRMVWAYYSSILWISLSLQDMSG